MELVVDVALVHGGCEGAHGFCLSEMRGYQLMMGGAQATEAREAAKATKRSGGQAHAWQGPHWLEIRGASRWSKVPRPE